VMEKTPRFGNMVSICVFTHVSSSILISFMRIKMSVCCVPSLETFVPVSYEKRQGKRDLLIKVLTWRDARKFCLKRKVAIKIARNRLFFGDIASKIGFTK